MGVLGGTFDPVHLAHLVVANEVLTAAGLDEVVFVPAGDPWQKSTREVTDAATRLEMVRLAVADNPAFAVSDVDVVRQGPTYTVDTLADLRATYPSGTRFSLILGQDAAAALGTWREPERVLAEAEVLVVGRPGSDAEPEPRFADRIQRVRIPLIEVSSTDLRARVRAGRSIRYLVPDQVAAFIAERGLYRSAER